MPNVELKRGQEVKEDAFEIRRRVFMEEQGYTDEFDDIDDTCIHIVLYKKRRACGLRSHLPRTRRINALGCRPRSGAPREARRRFWAHARRRMRTRRHRSGGDRNVPARPSSTRELVWPHGIHALRRSRLRRRRSTAHLDGKDHLAPLAATPHIETIRMASGFLAWLRARQINVLVETTCISGDLP